MNSKTNKNFQADVTIQQQTANRVIVLDATKKVLSSAVTITELETLSGISGDIQDQIDAKIPLTQKGASNGVATLDGGGKIPASQLPNSVFELKGFWNAATNTPTLVNGVGNPGDVWEVDTAGTVDFGAGPIVFKVGDWAVYAADNLWHKSINSNEVASVNGQTGIVVLDTDDVLEGASLYFTDERAQDSVGNILVDTSSINLTYSDATPAITADVIPGGVDHNQLANYSANRHVDHSGVAITTDANSGLAGGGDITATRNLVVDINGTTSSSTPDNLDEILIWDQSAGARRKQTRANFLSGVSRSSAGDLEQLNFSFANDVSSAADVTGFAFSNLITRSFDALVSVEKFATSDVFEEFKLSGIKKSSVWELSVESTGDDSEVNFSITNAGQVQYTSSNAPGFIQGIIRFRAITTAL